MTKMLAQHRVNDGQTADAVAETARKVERLQNEAAELRQWLRDNPQDRAGSRGSIRKSNRTDPESAMMATSKGVIQGYIGVAAVDARCQVIVEAQAHGTGGEQELLLPVIGAIKPLLCQSSVITADAGYHSEANLQALESQQLDALIADNAMRTRDERFADRLRHQDKPDPLHNKSQTPKTPATFGPEAFDYDPDAKTCICPAGKSLYRNGSHVVVRGLAGVKFRGTIRDCGPCPLRTQCLRKPNVSQTRQVVFFQGKDISS